MNERERRLDVGLLQSGKFAEALAGLEKWLADTEDMVNNQKPPSADYKVVKAQLQEQKVCLIILLIPFSFCLLLCSCVGVSRVVYFLLSVFILCMGRFSHV